MILVSDWMIHVQTVIMWRVWTNHGGAVVIIFVCRFPWFQTAPTETVVALGTGHTEDTKHHHCHVLWHHQFHHVLWHHNVLQTALVLLDLGLAARAAFGDQLGQMFALSLHAHPFIVSSIIHPLRHVAAAGRVVGLEGTREDGETTIEHTEHRFSGLQQ